MDSTPASPTAGFVLAGGRSVRMGSNKALLRFRGRTLVEYVAGEVLKAAGSVALVGMGSTPEFRGIPDLYPGFGPTGGLVTALADSGAEWNLVVACDMPNVHSKWLRNLLDTARNTDCQALIPVTGDGRTHPLCAVYARSSYNPLRRAAEEGIHTVREALLRLKTMQLPVEDFRLLANVNTPEDWAAIPADKE